MYARALLDRAATLIFPDRCIFCGQALGYCESQICICHDCADKLTFSDEVPTCRLCGRHLSENERLCDTCQTHRHYFNRAVSCLMYERDVRRVILQYKFGGRPDLCRTFAAIMIRRIRPLCRAYRFDLVVCAPLSKKAKQERGYNQSALLAKRIAADLQIPFMEDAFCKIKETPKQSTLHYADRMRNVTHAFALTKPQTVFSGKSILLVDDVLTTGATADALSKLLKQAGTRRVVVAALATTDPDRTAETADTEWKDIEF